MEPCLSVILLAYNDAATIEATLDSVYKQTFFTKGGKVNLIIIPNGCTDSTVDKINDFISANEPPLGLDVKLMPLSEGDRNKAINFGLTKTTDTIVGYLNADCTISKDTFSVLFQAFKDNPNLLVAGANDQPDPKYIDTNTLLSKIIILHDLVRELRRKVPTGRCMFFKRNLFHTLPVDIHSEDHWIDKKACIQGGRDSYKVFYDAVVFYIPSTDWTSYIQQWTRYLRGTRQLIERYPEFEEWVEKSRVGVKKISFDEVVEKIEQELPKRIKNLSVSECKDLISYFRFLMKVFEENQNFLKDKIITSDGKWTSDRHLTDS